MSTHKAYTACMKAPHNKPSLEALKRMHTGGALKHAFGILHLDNVVEGADDGQSKTGKLRLLPARLRRA